MKATAVLVAVVGLAVTLVVGVFAPQLALRAYLAAVLAWMALPLGALALVMSHRLAQGQWGRTLSADLEAQVRTLPLAMLLFLPLMAGLTEVWTWVEDGPHKDGWLDGGAFLVRSAIYLLVWFALGGLALQGGGAAAAFGLIVYTLTVSFAAYDWAMSLDPHWHSSIFGLVVIAKQMLAALCLAAAATLIGRGADPGQVRAFGAMILGAVMVWGYLVFMQYLVIWSADLPSETRWYFERSAAGWQVVWWVLGLGHGAALLALLSGELRASRTAVTVVALTVLGLQFLEWPLIVLAGTPAEGWLTLLAGIGAMAGAGGVWWVVFSGACRRLRQRRAEQAHG